MEQTGLKKALIQLHLSVMLAGFTGLFGKLVTLNETPYMVSTRIHYDDIARIYGFATY